MNKTVFVLSVVILSLAISFLLCGLFVIVRMIFSA